jgi:hypothetical protein
VAAAEPQELQQFHSEQRAAIDFLVLAKAQVQNPKFYIPNPLKPPSAAGRRCRQPRQLLSLPQCAAVQPLASAFLQCPLWPPANRLHAAPLPVQC